MLLVTSTLGFPRIGRQRELKKLLEAYWKGDITSFQLEETTTKLKEQHWKQQLEAGIQHIPSNDFSLYDHVLDCAMMVGAIPSRYQQQNTLDVYFAMARGTKDVTAMEMTKWFDTNYHYIVPELSAETTFNLTSEKPILEFNHAKTLGIITRPVILGPISFLLLSKMKDNSNRWDLLPNLISVYKEILIKLKSAGAEWIQIDEPFLVCDIDADTKTAYEYAYTEFSHIPHLKYLLTTYFGALNENLTVAAKLPIHGLHIDLVRGPNQLEDVCKVLPAEKWLSLGLVDGRNIWITDLSHAENKIREVIHLGRDKIIISSSCSLLHVPVDLEMETQLDDELKNWLAFATQKLDEIAFLAKTIQEKKDTTFFEKNANAIKSRQTSTRIHNTHVKQAINNITPTMLKRSLPFKERHTLQQAILNLPLFPTTTIGSYPQTEDVRQARSDFKKGKLSKEQYEDFLRKKTIEAMQWQNEIGMDVPVHGEFERNDMVEYFGEKLQGFAFTENGWVQSYGSRCVKPPIIYGDVSRPEAMTVNWSAFAQQHTTKPVKGMLTGPVTILQWSFVRNDQPREITCYQIALAIRQEVIDLETAGIRIIQIDEPALREGLPLKRNEWKTYLHWAIEAFRLCSSGVKNETQIHTHMCYSEFNDIIEEISALDADVISIETSRSAMELLNAFVKFKYPNQIGPGIYDIHSPRIPNQKEMEHLLLKALKQLSPQQLWVNPDCGLKTRRWEEVKPAIKTMIAAALTMRLKVKEINLTNESYH